MRVFTAIAAILVLSGCESDFHKCFNAELAKLPKEQAGQKVLEAYAAIDEFGDRTSDLVRAAETASRKAGPMPDRCATQQQQDDECRAFFEAIKNNVDKATKSLGLSDLETAWSKASDAESAYDRVSDKRAEHSLLSALKPINAEYFNNYEPDDIDRAVEWSMTQLRTRHEIYTKTINDQRAEELVKHTWIATETCNQRGIYE